MDRRSVLQERLCPVVSVNGTGGSWKPAMDGDVPLLAYLDDSFMGQVFNRQIHPRVPRRFRLVRVCGSALTAAILELTLTGFGVAWLPHLLAARGLEEGRLLDLTTTLGDCAMDVVILRPKTERSRIEDDVWSALSGSKIG